MTPPKHERRALSAGVLVSLGVVALSLILAGCGGARRAATTAANKAPGIAFASPSMAGGGPSAPQTIPVRYTCDGANTTPAFQWGTLPANTAALALFLFRVNRAAASAGSTKAEVKLEWAVAGLSPKIHGVPAGKLPRGAFVALNHYSICPPKGSATTYIFQLNALSHRLAAGRRANPSSLFQEAESSTVASGAFVTLYKRA